MKEVTRIWWIMKDFAGGLEWAECLWARAILPIGLAHFDDDEPIVNDSISSMILGMDGQNGQLTANSRAILP